MKIVDLQKREPIMRCERCGLESAEPSGIMIGPMKIVPCGLERPDTLGTVYPPGKSPCKWVHL